jgi:hypothetical protein|tara:strand:- start:207 stop:446 length:240 start_codon:yes stop_codon:yes gene_type:complete
MSAVRTVQVEWTDHDLYFVDKEEDAEKVMSEKNVHRGFVYTEEELNLLRGLNKRQARWFGKEKIAWKGKISHGPNNRKK